MRTLYPRLLDPSDLKPLVALLPTQQLRDALTVELANADRAGKQPMHITDWDPESGTPPPLPPSWQQQDARCVTKGLGKKGRANDPMSGLIGDGVAQHSHRSSASVAFSPPPHGVVRVPVRAL